MDAVAGRLRYAGDRVDQLVVVVETDLKAHVVAPMHRPDELA